MREYIRLSAAPLALTLVLMAGACKDSSDDQLATDTTLNRDLEMAGRDTMAQPQLTDVPSTSGKASTTTSKSGGSVKTTTPAKTTTTRSGNTVTKTPSGSEGRLASIASGTSITLNSKERVCTNTHKPGDKFSATVQNAVMGSNGAMIPAGATAVVQVTSVERSENANDPARLGLVVQNISWGGNSYPVDASITNVSTETQRESKKSDDVKKVAAGAVVGAVLGQILGKDTKSTVIGAATGAAAGTAIAMGTADYAGCIPMNGNIVIRLNSPAKIQAD